MRSKRIWRALVCLIVAMMFGCAGDGAPDAPPPVAEPWLSDAALLAPLVSDPSTAGYLIGATPERLQATQADRAAAETAVRLAREQAADTQGALRAPSADLNGDGLMTTDELIALSKVHTDDNALLRELAATGCVFELNPSQQDYLLAHDVPRSVVGRLPQLNSADRRRIMQQRRGG